MVLIVVPTESEWRGIFPDTEPPCLGWNGSENIVDMIHLPFAAKGVLCGMGPVASAIHTTRALCALGHVELVLHLGLAGTYDTQKAPLESLVWVERDCLADWGVAQSGGPFQSARELGWGNPDVECNNIPSSWVSLLKNMNRFKGATVSSPSATRDQALARAACHQAQVESMEGYSVLKACGSLPCLQVRAISNLAGDRDMKRWRFDACFGALRKWVERS